MEISYDTSAGKVSSAPVSTETFSFTNSGNCLILHTSSNAGRISSITYNGVAMTKAIDIAHTGLGYSGIWYLVNPPIGTYTISMTGAGTTYYVGNAASYYGVDQTNPLNGTYSVNGSSNTFTSTITSTVDKCWHVCGMRYSGAELSAGTGTTIRSNTALNDAIADGNGPVTPAGSNTLTLTGATSNNYGLVGIMIRPLANNGAGFFALMS